MPEISWNSFRDADIEREADRQRSDTTSQRIEDHVVIKAKAEAIRRKQIRRGNQKHIDPHMPILALVILAMLLVGCRTSQPDRLPTPPAPRGYQNGVDEGELRIDSFVHETITNHLGTKAKRLSYTVSGMVVSSNYAFSVNTELPCGFWIAIDLWTATNDVQSFVTTNSQGFLFQPAVFGRVESF